MTQNPMSVAQILQRNGDRHTSFLAAKQLAALIKDKYPDLHQNPQVAQLIDLIERP